MENMIDGVSIRGLFKQTGRGKEVDKCNKRLQEVADGYTQSRFYAGIAWQVEKSGETIAQGTSGTSDEAGKTPLTDDGIFRIYSMTKPIVSMDRYMPVKEAEEFMKKKKLRHLAVTEDDEIVGILSVKDLVSCYSKSFRMVE